MNFIPSRFCVPVALVPILCALAAPCRAEEASAKEQANADRISKEVAEIRGLPLKKRILVENQSMEDFKKYVAKSLDAQMPKGRERNFGKVVKALGLHRGEEIKDYREMATMVATSQAAAYYDPATNKFYVLMQDMNEMMMGTVYAHELTHGLQDQNFDLQKYLLDQASGALNDDELIARQSVVEGEATYTMTLWQMKEMSGAAPDRETLGPIVKMQANMDIQMMRMMLQGGGLSQLGVDGMEDAIAAMEKIPDFILETMMGAYLKGMSFVFEIEEGGWDEVDKLYKKAPPVSSEQILHPEKWTADEKPFKIAWPKLEKAEALAGWKLLDENVIGELQWRVIFAEHGLKRESKKAADGWDGDAYAVFEKKSGKGMLTLIYTCWDSEDEAGEFALNYNRLLKEKFPGKEDTATIESDGADVLIIEGADEKEIDAIKALMKEAKKTK